MGLLPQNLSMLGRLAFIVIVAEWLSTTCNIVRILGQIVNSLQPQSGIVNGTGNSSLDIGSQSQSSTVHSPAVIGLFGTYYNYLVLFSIFFLIETCTCLGFTVTAMRKLHVLFLEIWCRFTLFFLLFYVAYSFYIAVAYPTICPPGFSLGTPEFLLSLFEVWILHEYAKELQDQKGPQNENIIVRGA